MAIIRDSIRKQIEDKEAQLKELHKLENSETQVEEFNSKISSLKEQVELITKIEDLYYRSITMALEYDRPKCLLTLLSQLSVEQFSMMPKRGQHLLYLATSVPECALVLLSTIFKQNQINPEWSLNKSFSFTRHYRISSESYRTTHLQNALEKAGLMVLIIGLYRQSFSAVAGISCKSTTQCLI